MPPGIPPGIPPENESENDAHQNVTLQLRAVPTTYFHKKNKKQVKPNETMGQESWLGNVANKQDNKPAPPAAPYSLVMIGLHTDSNSFW